MTVFWATLIYFRKDFQLLLATYITSCSGSHIATSMNNNNNNFTKKDKIITVTLHPLSCSGSTSRSLNSQNWGVGWGQFVCGQIA